jgi:hypothetical protein
MSPNWPYSERLVRIPRKRFVCTSGRKPGQHELWPAADHADSVPANQVSVANVSVEGMAVITLTVPPNCSSPHLLPLCYGPYGPNSTKS